MSWRKNLFFSRPLQQGLLALAAGFLLAGCAATATPSVTPLPSLVETPMPLPSPLPPTPAATPAFRIIGYVTDWDTIVDRVQFDKLTHINYAFLLPKEDGTFASLANAWKLKDVVTRAHAANGKVLISVGGWGYDEQFKVLAADPAKRAVFVAGLVQFVQDYNLDGADIDWEYPRPTDSSAQDFVTLMGELRTALPAEKLLTAAVIAQGSTGTGILPEVFPLVDFLNIMAYDASSTDHSPYAFAEQALDFWLERGLPPEKAVLGVPFYSRPDGMSYRKLVAHNPQAANGDTLDVYGVVQYYNGIPTIQQKTRLARQRASGIMIWALAHDTDDQTSLLNAIYQVVHAP